MPAYVLLATISARLPTGHGLSDNTINGFIADCSGEVDELAGMRYSRAYNSDAQKFPEITGTPATPKTIEQCAKWLVISTCFEELEKANRYKDENMPSNKIYYRQKAEKKMRAVASGEVDLDISPVDKIYRSEKYPDDESDFDRVFTNEELDNYSYS